MTTEQWDAVEKLGEDYHVVLVDPADPPGAVTLTPAKFCELCGGDGVEPDSPDKPESEACSRCEGRGGIPVTYEPVVVLPDGSPA